MKAKTKSHTEEPQTHVVCPYRKNGPRLPIAVCDRCSMGPNCIPYQKALADRADHMRAFPNADMDGLE